MIDAVRTAGIPADALPRFRISGCVSSCGCHQVGVIGLQGATRTVDGGSVPSFAVTIDGCGLQGKERFGHSIGAIAEDRIPEAVVLLGRTVAQSGMAFDEWYSSNDIQQVWADYLI